MPTILFVLKRNVIAAEFQMTNGNTVSLPADALSIGDDHDVTLQVKPLPGFMDGNVRVTLDDGDREVVPTTAITRVAGISMFVTVGPAVFRSTRAAHRVNIHVTGVSPPAEQPTVVIRAKVVKSPW